MNFLKVIMHSANRFVSDNVSGLYVCIYQNLIIAPLLLSVICLSPLNVGHNGILHQFQSICMITSPHFVKCKVHISHRFTR